MGSQSYHSVFRCAQGGGAAVVRRCDEGLDRQHAGVVGARGVPAAKEERGTPVSGTQPMGAMMEQGKVEVSRNPGGAYTGAYPGLCPVLRGREFCW